MTAGSRLERVTRRARLRMVRRAVSLRQRYFDDFVFIHINKTGGSSVEKALKLNFEHKTALEKIAELGRARWDKRFSFTFVRNPWEKVVSHYHYRVKTDQTNLASGRIGFGEWVKLTYGGRHPSYYDHPKMFMPQLDWISDADGRILVDFVGRFERLEEDFKEICQRLGARAELPHLKSSGHGGYRQYYDEDTARIVAEWFRRDVDRFGYEFGGN